MVKAVFVDLFPTMFDAHGIYSLSAVCRRAGIDVDYVGERRFVTACDKVVATGASFVLYSSFSATAGEYEEFDRMLKKRINVTSVIGGPGPTFDRGDSNEVSIDAFCIGEGEDALPAFIAEGKTDRNIRRSGDGVTPTCYYPFTDLDALPFPDRSIVYRHDSFRRTKSVKHFLSGRGCPYDCSFCFNHAYREIFRGSGKPVRKKSVDYFIEEMLQVRREYGFVSAAFSDDTFILDKKWLQKFCSAFAEKIGTPYTCGVRANLMDDDTARMLRESGCSAVNWSIEAGDETLRNDVLKRNMSDEQIIRTAELLHKYKISFLTGNIIGSPGETFAQMDKTVHLNIRVKPALALAKIFAPYPGLALTDYAIKNGFYDGIVKPGKDDLYSRSLLNYTLSEKVNIQKLMTLFPLFVSFGFLFTNNLMKKLLFAFPAAALRIVYELFSGYRTMRLYVVRTPFSQKVRMLIRYLVNIVPVFRR